MTKLERLLNNPELLIKSQPFLRGCKDYSVDDMNDGEERVVGERTKATLPDLRKTEVTQARFAKELDSNCHDVMFDENLPKICVKLSSGNYEELRFKRMGLPLQKRIREKQTLSLCGNRTKFTLRGNNPDDKSKSNFDLYKEYWEDRNMDGWRTKAIFTQKGYGNSGLLFYHNEKNEIKCRLISYEDNYVIITHKDDNGEHLLECLYYKDEQGIECIDAYDATFIHRYRKEEGEWHVESKKHGFDEIPLATKRGDVAWNDVQSIIDILETMYNLFIVIQKRNGWGILYIRGRFKEDARQLAGSIILNDTSLDGKGTAEFKAPPSPQGMLDILQSLYEHIQIGSSTTFLLPKDIKSSGDISAIAIMLTQSLDLEGATNGVIEWQNFIDKMVRLFKFGLAKELVHKGINENAVTEFAQLRIGAELKVWRPFNEVEYNQMLCTLKNSGIISHKTAIEKNTVSNPDEESRIFRELETNIYNPVTATINEQNAISKEEEL